jgi:RNA polymerase sigma-70 factor (ECF subfamily)
MINVRTLTIAGAARPVSLEVGCESPPVTMNTARGAGPTLQEMYRLYGAPVFRRARTLLRDADWARDATQEVFLRAAQNPVRVSTCPLPWLFRVTRNLCLNNLRDNRRRGRLLAGHPVEAGAVAPHEARLAVTQLLSRVPEDLQEIALYYYVDDLSHEDIAAIVGVSRRTIGNRLASFQALADALFTDGNAA